MQFLVGPHYRGPSAMGIIHRSRIQVCRPSGNNDVKKREHECRKQKSATIEVIDVGDAQYFENREASVKWFDNTTVVTNSTFGSAPPSRHASIVTTSVSILAICLHCK